MTIKVAVLKETRAGERRVAMVPDVVDRVSRLGTRVFVQSGAGDAIKLPDPAFKNATVVADVTQLVADADIVLAVQPPSLETVKAMKIGAILVAFIYANKEPALVEALHEKNITCFAMERVPRITRAQAMDALSTQAALSGYYGALLGATHLARIFPRMTTAVGSLRPATVLVMGLGVAGLQALATARRLGAVTEGYDVRSETREEAASLGAKFVDTGIDATGEGGYARELSQEEKERVAKIVTAHVQQADVVITTAAVPGRPSPKLISKAQVDGMKAGAVIVDLAADGGGNCECTEPGKTVQVGQVTIVAPLNVASLLGEHASELYAKNVLNLLELIIHDEKIAPDWNDDVLAKTALTRADESSASATGLEAAEEPV
ncbi:MAG TPA: NAD(P) transhydrogenase subunit alpha [Dyella sp.]|uniref:NAD(P) transhydrogenase subunit alpha n=1 Tax=Dyella sp. TaxID=1869338 RepID=UPI002CA21517|nr:NAD(P) transhydrogenase subunit alpha [Dyella sp.]HUB88997.1 NAD(P) transhydrogenase subunit alpha [Dyella sp.]